MPTPAQRPRLRSEEVLVQRIVFFPVALIAMLVVTLSGYRSRAGDGRQRDLYLASRDEIRLVLKILGEMPSSQGGTFIGIVGGLAALNFIERLAPADILLVDLNPAQVEYGRCVTALIKLSPSRTEFVSAFFSRPFESDEPTFLAQPGDETMLQSNMERIKDRSLRESCKSDLALVSGATYDSATQSLLVQRNSNGRYLRLRGPDKGMPRGFNYLYFDRGWLESDASYGRTRSALMSARVRFLASDIGAVSVEEIRGREIFFWGTNLATWFGPGREAYERFVIRAHEEFASRNQAIRFAFASTYRHTACTNFVPFEQLGAGVHLDASAKVRKHAQGKRVLELIPGKAYFGKELRAKESVVQNASQPIDPSASFDVAVLHILNNSGMKWWREDRTSEFRALYESVLGRANEVVILEHNRRSQDFSDKERSRMVGLAELLEPLFPVLAKRRLTLDLEPAVGETDNTRNLVLHIKKR